MHWVVGLIIIGNLISGYIMTDLESPFKFTIYSWHKFIGVVVLGLVILRIIIRLCSSIPTPPKEIKSSDILLSQIGVAALYICMIIMPLSGYLMSAYGGYPIMLMDISIPNIVKVNTKLSSLYYNAHMITSYMLSAFIIGHILYSVKHLIVDKINLFKRMMY